VELGVDYASGMGFWNPEYFDGSRCDERRDLEVERVELKSLVSG